MDTVFIRELALETVIGVHAWERRLNQRLVLDLELGWDAAVAVRDDDLAAALDYSAVCATAREVAGSSSFRLVESLAEHLAMRLMAVHGVPWLRLTLSKPGAVAGARAVGVVIERGARR